MRYIHEQNRQNPFWHGSYALVGGSKNLKSKHKTQFQQMRDAKKIKQKAMESEAYFAQEVEGSLFER